MSVQPKAESTTDSELDARLSRLQSELMQVRSDSHGDTGLAQQFKDVERRLADIPTLSDHGQRILAIHQVEAALCMFKLEHSLYPTWTRLRDSLYRFSKDRREAWKGELSPLFSPEGKVLHSDIVRHRLRQLTLELNEAAARYNRLAKERAAVTREVNKLGILIITLALAILLVAFAISGMNIGLPWLLPISLLSSMAAGCMGATFGRLTTIRSERARYAFSTIFKWDMWARVCLGAVSALFVAAALYSGFFPIGVPDPPVQRLAFFVIFGFAAGFSDRLFNQTLEKIIGSRASRRPTDTS